jgi:glycosyltransferase involved in cell wall biosynthesis
MLIKHTVVIIAYNQEEFILRALDSIFGQKVIPFEVIIGDDCSSDKTRNILLDYFDRYPEIIKLKFHEKNLGMYENLNSLMNEISGDMVHFLAGDDWFEGEMFLRFNEIIISKNLDCEKEKFLIMPNFYRYSNNELKVVNNYQHRKVERLTLKVQNLASNRGVGLSKKLAVSVPHHDTTIGPWADWLFDIGVHLSAKKIIFINEAFPVYRINVGVTSKYPPEYFWSSYIATINKIFELYEDQLTFRHKVFLLMQKARTEYFMHGRASLYFKYLILFAINIPLFEYRANFFKEIKNLIPPFLKSLLKSFISYYKK